MEELIGVALTLTTGIAAGIAFIYRKGRNAGLDKACERRIIDKIECVEKTVKETLKETDKVHDKIFENIHDIDVKIEKLKSSTDVVFDMIKENK